MKVLHADFADLLVSYFSRYIIARELVNLCEQPGLWTKNRVSLAYRFLSFSFFYFSLQAVEKWLVDRAVLPIENSLGGSIHRNYDLLIRHRLHIVGEVKLAVKHCLLANHGVEIGDLTRVLSHPQVLMHHLLTGFPYF